MDERLNRLGELARQIRGLQGRRTEANREAIDSPMDPSATAAAVAVGAHLERSLVDYFLEAEALRSMLLADRAHARLAEERRQDYQRQVRELRERAR